MLEGEKMPTVLCTADCNPACHVTWTTNNDRVSGNGTLSLGRLDTSKDGTYTCTARGGTRTETVTINVTTSYGPKTISLSPPGDVSVEEEERIDVRCQASCSPSCDICWTGPNTYQAGRRGPNLLIRHADRTDRGVYVCVASNDYGNISTSLRVNVNYAGSDIKLVPNDTHYSDKEGTVLPDIRCVAECNPACEMSWYHDRTGRLVVGSTLSLKNMKRSKDGNYMCNATNNLGPQTLSLTVVSLFPPEVLRKDLLNTSYDVDEWDSVFSSISVDASPLPQADLVHVGVDQQEATNVVLQSQRQPVSYRTEFSYSIRNITYSDVGHYTLTVSNSQGDFTYKFSINIIHEGSFGNGGGASHLTAVLVIIVVTVSIAIMLVIVALIFVFRRKQNRERQDKNSGDSDGTLNGEHNVLYGHQEDAPAGLRGFPQQPVDDAEGFIGIHDAEGRPKPVNDVYAEVVRPSSNNRPASAGPSNVYGTGTKPSATDRAKSAGPRDIYSTVSKPTAGKNQELGPETTRTTNKDGLVYLEVDFTKKTDGEETGKVAIHGIENKCDYGEIDFSKKVNLPEDMEN
ncbi:hemicentin-2-like [Mizuhopecten yessoensis]|uniref:hemicentin-2-like n=1 Tax=Mizuhopecten yessoensis TaxID=6573 RepID=UPI000B45E522|nr:hemicentin-2-like [Mizuhopecten yessoensis]